MSFSTEFKLGSFVLGTSLALAFLILTFGEIPVFREETKTYIVYFDDVAGLSKGAEVRVAGIRYGKVKDIYLENGKVKVIFELSKDVEIYKNARASIGTLGLMGEKFLAIDPGDPKYGVLEEGGRIEVSEGVADTDILIRELTETARAFKEVAYNLNQILEENRTTLRKTIANLSELTETLDSIARENRENLKVLIKEMAELSENLNRTLPRAIASIERLSNELRGTVEENRKDIRELVIALKRDLPPLVKNLRELSENLNSIVKENREDIDRTIKNLSKITERLNTASKRLDRILEKLESGEGTLGKLITDERLYESVSKGVKLFEEAGEVITRTRVYLGFGGEAYTGGDNKGFIFLRVEPSRDTYFLLEVVGDSRGRVYTEEIVGQGEIVRKEYKPEFTLQIAKKFFIGNERYFTVRAGLKESTGGIGFDFVPSRKWKLYSDIWDTGRKDRPNEEGLAPLLQIGVQWYPKRPLFVRFGGDDLLNEELRGAFVGAGLEFSEDYIKYIFGAVGLPFP